MSDQNIISFIRAKKDYCQHQKLIVDDEADRVKCADCGKKLNPMFVLSRFAKKERLRFARIAELQRLEDNYRQKTRFKCEYCRKMNFVDLVKIKTADNPAQS